GRRCYSIGPGRPLASRHPIGRRATKIEDPATGGDRPMNRRQLLCAGLAGAALLARVPPAGAATYDLIIKGGRVIDPSLGLDAIRDVAIARGRIAVVDANVAGDATETIDARGKIVAPGLIDIHTHAGRTKEGPPMALQDGVTAWVDAGSAGADNIDQI